MSTRHTSESLARPDASMTLLNEVYRRPLDPGYAEAAANRAAHATPRRARRSVAGLVALAVVLGAGVTTATIDLRRPAGSVVEARQLLEAQIVQRGDEASALQKQVEELSAEITALQDDVLGDEQHSLAAQLAQDAVGSGAVPVSGPGLRIELSDAPAPDLGEPDPDDRVRDVDLQVLVNGLWAVGAEAIAVNGQRLTSMTAIRSAGDAVLVDLVALSSPYTVDAVGDAPRMQTALAQATAGQYLATLRNSYGIGVRVSSAHALDLPGVGQTTLYYAVVPAEVAPKALPGGNAGAEPTTAERATARASTGTDVAGSAGRSGRDGT